MTPSQQIAILQKLPPRSKVYEVETKVWHFKVKNLPGRMLVAPIGKYPHPGKLWKIPYIAFTCEAIEVIKKIEKSNGNKQ